MVPPPDEQPLFDLRPVWLALRFAWASVVSQRLLAVATAAACVFVGAAVILALPTYYECEVKLLVQKNQVMPALVNPRRMFSLEDQNVMPSARDATLRREVLQRMVRELRLVEEPGGSFGWLPLFGSDDPLAREEEEERLIATIERRITVEMEKGLLTIGATWTDPERAAGLARIALGSWLDTRRDEEVRAVAETVEILDARAAEVEQEAEKLLASVLEARVKKKSGSRAATLRSLQADGGWGRMPDPKLVALRNQVLAKRRAIDELAETHRKQLAEAHAIFADQRTRLGESHPELQATRSRIRTLGAEPGALAVLREEEQQLLRDYVKLGGRDVDLAPEVGQSATVEAEPEDPTVEHTKDLLRATTARAAELRTSVDTARAELAAAQAAFKYRYVTVKPALVPRRPSGPNRLLLSMALLVLAAISAALLCSIATLLGKQWEKLLLRKLAPGERLGR